MPDDYGYANARLRAMWSRLLTTTEYEDLLARENVEALISALTATEYEDDIETAVLHASGVRCVVEALRQNTSRTFRRMRTFFETAEQQKLVGVLLSRWDLFNVKTIIRGQVARIPTAEILETVVPAGQLDEIALETLAGQPDLQATVDMMLTQRLPYAHPLAVAIHSYRGREDLVTLELALERFHYGSNLASLQGGSPHADLVRQLVETEIDTLNLSVFLRLWRETQRTSRQAVGSPLGTINWLISGGSLGNPCWQALAKAETVDDIVESLYGTVYRQVVESGLGDGYADAGAHWARLLERHLIMTGLKMWYGDPLSIAMAIGYTWAKIDEVVNLRLIAYAVVGELARETAREEWYPWRSAS